MTELKTGTCSENQEVEEYEETKAPQEKDYSIHKEHNGKVINYFLEMKLIEKKRKDIKSYLLRSGGRRSRLVRPFEKNLNLTIIGPTRTLKLQGFDHK